MTQPDVDDLFKDFEYKIEGKKEEPKKRLEFFKKDPEAKNEPEKKTWAQVESPVIEQQEARPRPKSTAGIERLMYIAIIGVLISYISIDFAFYHTDNKAESDISKGITAGVVDNATKENKTQTTIKTEQIKNETTVQKPNEEINKTSNETKITNETKAANETKKYSGTINLTIESVDAQVTNQSLDLGAINSITFTINNDKDKILKPLLNVFVYDSKMDKSWEVTSRGKYTYDLGIQPGENHTGIIDVTPKTFRNLNLSKSIRLTLNDTNAGYITVANTEISIS